MNGRRKTWTPPVVRSLGKAADVETNDKLSPSVRQGARELALRMPVLEEDSR
jgi:hypothetical protein